MSATFLWACDQRPKDPLAKNILFVLASFANWDTGECFPSLARIAEISECSRRTVIRKLEQLEKAGYIKISPRKNGSSNLILLQGYLGWRKKSKNHGKELDETTEKTSDTQTPVSDRHQCQTDRQVVTVSPEVVTHSPTGGDPQAPITSNITSKRTSNRTLSPFAENEKQMKEALSVVYNEEPRVEIRENKIFLCKHLRELWLKQFNNQENQLDLALIKILPRLKDRNPAGLEKEVSGQLAGICLERSERDGRYAAAVALKKDDAAKKEKKPFTPSRWGINYD